MIKLKSLLTEGLNQEYWYHGRTVDSDVFSYDYVGGENANDQEGPGFYFTSDFNNAKYYAENRGIVLKCKINYKKVILKNISPETKASKKIIVDLIQNSPNKEYTLENFDENPKVAFVKAVNAYLAYGLAFDSYQTIANDFYKHLPKKYLSVLSKHYDAQLTRLDNSLYGDIYHLIVYNPSLIQVIEKIKLQ